MQTDCSAQPVPAGNRVAWFKSTAQTYAGIMLWFVFWQDAIVTPNLGGALAGGVVWALVSLVLAACGPAPTPLVITKEVEVEKEVTVVETVEVEVETEVTVVEMLPTITPFADKPMAKALQRALADQGMEFRLETKVTAGKVLKKSVKLTVESAKGESEEISCDTVLVVPSGCGLSAELAFLLPPLMWLWRRRSVL